MPTAQSFTFAGNPSGGFGSGFASCLSRVDVTGLTYSALTLSEAMSLYWNLNATGISITASSSVTCGGGSISASISFDPEFDEEPMNRVCGNTMTTRSESSSAAESPVTINGEELSDWDLYSRAKGSFSQFTIFELIDDGESVGFGFEFSVDSEASSGYFEERYFEVFDEADSDLEYDGRLWSYITDYSEEAIIEKAEYFSSIQYAGYSATTVFGFSAYSETYEFENDDYASTTVAATLSNSGTGDFYTY